RSFAVSISSRQFDSASNAAVTPSRTSLVTPGTFMLLKSDEVAIVQLLREFPRFDPQLGVCQSVLTRGFDVVPSSGNWSVTYQFPSVTMESSSSTTVAGGFNVLIQCLLLGHGHIVRGGHMRAG